MTDRFETLAQVAARRLGVEARVMRALPGSVRGGNPYYRAETEIGLGIFGAYAGGRWSPRRIAAEDSTERYHRER